nr:immunoglobulin heavy chain junction region [Macaca mulatta]
CATDGGSHYYGLDSW